jgi:hypothetical protein
LDVVLVAAPEDCAIAFSKMKSNLIKSALSPLLCLGQPKLSAFWFQHGALSAHPFRIWDLNELVHSFHSPSVKPFTHVPLQAGVAVAQKQQTDSDFRNRSKSFWLCGVTVVLFEQGRAIVETVTSIPER